MFLDVVGMVGGSEDFGFIDIVYANGFKDLFGGSVSTTLSNSFQDTKDMIEKRGEGQVLGIQQNVQFWPLPSQEW